MILGHEIAGTVVATGADVTGVQAGDTVAVNPSLPCGVCRYCLDGHVQPLPGHAVLRQRHAHAARPGRLPRGTRLHSGAGGEAAAGRRHNRAVFAEPLSVCLHAARQAGPLLGRRVLVTGSGPIGALLVMVARQAGAREIVATDLLDAPLALVRTIGADRTINIRSEPAGLDGFAAGKGTFDVVFEASGAPSALAAAIPAVRPGATIVQVGIGADASRRCR